MQPLFFSPKKDFIFQTKKNYNINGHFYFANLLQEKDVDQQIISPVQLVTNDHVNDCNYSAKSTSGIQNPLGSTLVSARLNHF